MPYTEPWFLGVANLRGGLYGVVELVGLRRRRRRGTGANEATRAQSRLVALNEMLEVNCALLIDRLAGLRGVDAFVVLARRPQDAPAPGSDSGYTDAAGALLAGDQPAGAVAATPVPEHRRLSGQPCTFTT